MSLSDKTKEIERIKYVYGKYSPHSSKWSNNNIRNKLIYEERFENLKNLLELHNININNSKILDAGCAGGNFFASLLKSGIEEENIYGIDIRKNRIEDAKKKFPKSNLRLMDARIMDFQNDSFDIVLAFTLYSSILDKNIRKQISKEIVRVLNKGGVLLYYDIRYNNPFNRNVYKMTASDIDYLFPSMKKTLMPLTVSPPLIRKMGTLSRRFYPLLANLNLFKTHYLGLLKNV